MPIKLIDVIKSPIENKKWRALFRDGDREFHTDFGYSKMDDYTQHNDSDRRNNYRSRHAKDLDTKDPTRAGYLSYYILWGPYTNIKDNTVYYKNKFGY